jgi:hypothetical protein
MRVVADVWQVAAIVFCKGNQRFPLEKPSFSASENSVFS